MTDIDEVIAEVKRRCWRCAAEKPLQDFVRDRTRSSGYKHLCRHCDKKRARPTRRDRGVKAIPEYNVWCNMVARCHRPGASSYEWYGARGVRVCDEWRGKGGFRAFLDHIGRRPNATMQVDRIDNARGYEPGNVRWAAAKEQARNRERYCPRADGVCVKTLCEERALKYSTVVSRLRRGMTLEQAMSGTVDRRRHVQG